MKPRLYLAPIQGITDAIYRNTFSQFFYGFDVAVTPFIVIYQGSHINPSHLRDLLPENNRSIPIIPQILSNAPDDFILLARSLFDLGYEHINWNLGCPYPMVAKKKRGSGLLPHPELIKSFLDKTLPSIPNKLSIKTRLGRIRIDEIFSLMPIFNQYPLEELIIHPRTGKQMYKGKTDLDTFEKCLSMSIHPVVYNGDINDLDAYLRLSCRFGEVSRWMTGRGTLANPFLPAIIKSGRDNFSKKIETIKLFHDSLYDQYRQTLSGPAHLLGKMKGIWLYLSRSFLNKKNILKKINHAQHINAYQKAVLWAFTSELQKPPSLSSSDNDK